jgi:hypothetical protein
VSFYRRFTVLGCTNQLKIFQIQRSAESLAWNFYMNDKRADGPLCEFANRVRGGIFTPARRAFDSPMAIACGSLGLRQT